ncbi:MAG: YfcC family protein [Culicoidibacterales bacterium]
MNTMKKSKKIQLSAFSIIFIILIGLALLTWIVPDVQKANISNVVMAPYLGFKSAMDVCVFVLVLGGYLNVVQKTGTLDAGVQTLVKRMKGREIWLIPILMCLFALGGTTYGMSEETVAFYALICVTMVAVGFDTLTAVGTILLGAGIGTLASTVNPFATGIASDTAQKAGANINQGVVIGLGTVLLIINLIVCIWFVMRYAKKVQERDGSFLSTNEKSAMLATFRKDENEMMTTMNGRQKGVLAIFAFGFIFMVFSVIPWSKFGVEIPAWTGFLTGQALGDWWFGELAMWFLLLSIIVGLIAKMKEKMIVDAFVEGAADIVSVALIIAVARGASVLMSETHLDQVILSSASSLLGSVPGAVFAPVSYIFYLLISFFIPSTSGAATLTMPIMAPLTENLGYNPAVMIMIFSVASGIINLFTPTSGVVMGGLAISKVEYSTWIKWSWKLVATLAIMNGVILTIALLIL